MALNGTGEELKLKSPLRMVITIAVSAFVIEGAIMFLLSFLPPLPDLLEGLIDASVITILFSPVIYYFVFRPMTSYIAAISSARELIKDEKAKIEAIITGSQDAIIMMDGRGVITFWNPASEKMFGYTREEALDRILHELIVPERFRNDALKGLQAFKDTGEGPLIGVILEHAGLRKDGTEFYAEHSISPLKVKGEWHALGIVRDITERKQKETVIRGLLEKTEQSEEKYRNLVNTSPNAIFVHCEGRLVFINPAGARMLGAETPEQLIGKAVMDFVHPDYIETVKKRIKKILEQGESATAFEEKFIRLDGTVIDMEVSASSIIYDNKPAVQGVAIDITERKKAEKEILERIDELERFRKATVQREFRIKELRDENEELKRKLGIHKV